MLLRMGIGESSRAGESENGIGLFRLLLLIGGARNGADRYGDALLSRDRGAARV